MNRLYLFAVLIHCAYSQVTNPNKLCTDVVSKDACNNIERNETYECAVNIVSMTDCFLNIHQGLHQFAVVQPEQALLAANLVSDNVVVIGEIADHPPIQTVVIVRKFYNNTFENLRGKRLCHPGFKHDELITRYVLQEFESRIIKLNNTYCQINDNATILEKQISVLSSFFGNSCRPGVWTDDDDVLDKSLKTKYSNLCELCGQEKCDVTYQTPLKDALTCLTQNGGDVAVSSLADALVFFNDTNNNENFLYLCPDGSTRNSSLNSCTWTNQLKRLIITEKTVANDPKAYLEYHLLGHFSAFAIQNLGSNLALTESLEILLGLSKSDVITFIDPVPLKTYVSARREVPTLANNTYCQRTVSWCTENDNEQNKCLWLQQAALNTGLQPVIQCVQSKDTDPVSCLIDIQNGKADLTFADVTYGYIALKKGLTSVAYPETYNMHLASVVVVVRNDSTEINSLKDLKDKKACFPQYGGREWLAFIDTLKSKNVMEKSCDYGKLFGDFVSDSCVPGAHDNDFNAGLIQKDKLCKQCITTSSIGTAQTCNTDQFNKYYGTDGALKCLENRAGDFAVITLKDIKEYKDKSSSFKVLCQNGSLAQYNGFAVDSDAALTIITSGEVVAKNNTNLREDIIQLLKGIEIEFAQNLKKTFKVFEKFNDIPDLLFPDSTPGLTFDGLELGKHVENFKTLLRNSENCLVNPSSGINLVPSTLLMIIVMFLVRF
ncbi:unnamed protein product [Psylliodes chrysocephalus]|uniref:Transferrin-like domain-containing protein n=1 Tax=Psylliodes chrysocephalus TaxID=3402493 RepID=A0A9P0G892_9CUCU|nr:unnamed protein product [Psylliodes chrysocephala]